MSIVKNPILPGFNPDPSICSANGKFYLVTSTFSYFPGVPIYESEDLQHFRLLSNVLDREEQLPLMGGNHSAGIFAPTIRYNDGTFYMITTNVTKGGNFLVTSDKPEGPWSNPYYIQGAAGIDPSLFFDDDGTCYYVGTRPNPDGVRFNGDWVIYIQKFDTQTMELVGDYAAVWSGALKNAIWPEGPHLYKKDGWYYLLHAEGGTSFSHAISVARSKEIFGPYVGTTNNPIFTHRAFGKDFPIQNVGHSDMVVAENGEWYVIMLATRPIMGNTTLGRETFLAKVEWENGWPVFNPGDGKLLLDQQVNLPGKKFTHTSNTLHFNTPRLDQRIIGLRLLDDSIYSLTERKDYLRLRMKDITIMQKSNPSYLSVRQLHQSFIVETLVDIDFSQNDDSAGLVIMQNNEANIQLMCKYESDAAHITATVINKGVATELKSIKIDECTDKKIRVFLKIQKTLNSLRLLYAMEDGVYVELADDIDTAFLSCESAGGFVGCTIGMYATGATGTKGHADYAWLVYEGIECFND